jgi:hypothetical protein
VASGNNTEIVNALGRVEAGLADFRKQVTDVNSRLSDAITDFTAKLESIRTALPYLKWGVGLTAAATVGVFGGIITLAIIVATLPDANDIKEAVQPSVSKETLERMDRNIQELMQKRSDVVPTPDLKKLGWQMVNGSEYAYLDDVKLNGLKERFSGLAAEKGAFYKIASDTTFITLVQSMPPGVKFILASDDPKVDAAVKAILAKQ